MIITKKHLSRRSVLRGAGAALALPLLDSMIPAFASTAEVAAATGVKRFGAIYVGMGMNMPMWMQAEGPLKLNAINAPMQPFYDRMVVIAGLDNEGALSTDQGQHPRAQAAWLTGCRAKKTDGPDIFLGTSVDQIIARETAKETQLGSIEFTVEPTDLAGSCGYGFSCAYNNTIAWRTPTTPLPMENNPRNLFERLFGATDSTDAKVRARLMKANASVLDSLLTEVNGLKRGLGGSDERKMAEYLDAVRDAERRIQRAEEQGDKELPVVQQPAGMPATFEDYVKLMLDLQVLAFQTDLTRVFTFVMVRESSTRSYPEIGVADSHHPLSHHQNDTEKLARLSKINAFHVKQLAYLVDKLQATKDGNGTLFDNTLLLYGSGMSDSNLHVPENLPLVVVAGKRFDLKGNRFLQYPEKTPMANLHLRLLEMYGMHMEQFADSKGELNSLSV